MPESPITIADLPAYVARYAYKLDDAPIIALGKTIHARGHMTKP